VARRITINNRRLFSEAKHYLAGGVSSPVRSFGYVGGDPVLIRSGKGAMVCDYDDNKYIDYVLSWGASILGHADPQVARDVSAAITRGTHFGTTNDIEVDLARTISEACGFVDKIRFVNSGTEAVMGAVRLARGYTGRDKIIKFENSYHGHADYLLAKSGSGLATLQIPASAGVPQEFINATIVARHGDLGAVENIFNKEKGSIAAVIIEPVGGNYGVTTHDKKYLQDLAAMTKKHDALLISDEVITGFRLHYGAAAQLFGVVPDLVCLGKIVGGGLPVGAYGGSSRIMDRLAPLGDVYQASTFSGNPIVMQSGLSTLKILKRSSGEYEKAAKRTQDLTLGLYKEASSRGLGVKLDYCGSMFSLRFKSRKFFARVHRSMLEQGIYLSPSEFEANFLSFSHTDEHVKKTITAASAALEKAKGG
jgi:glutamate-1-semialdehyde 2,1-aminomutase